MPIILCAMFLFIASSTGYATQPDVVDRVLILYKLTPAQEAQFTATDNQISPFWNEWPRENTNGFVLDYISMNSSDASYAWNRCPTQPFSGSDDAVMEIRGAYSDKGVYLFIDSRDDSYQDYSYWATDVADIYVDALNSSGVAEPLNWFNPTQWALTFSTREIQVGMGGSLPTSGYNYRYYDDLNMTMTDHFAIFGDRTYDGMTMEIISISSTQKQQEWFIPATQWGITDITEGLRYAFSAGYNDIDANSTDCINSLRWQGLCDPYCEPPSAATWGDVELGPVLYDPNTVAPGPLSYSKNPASYVAGTAITPNLCVNGSPSAAVFSISPYLPSGLVFNTSNGTITGTPTMATPKDTFLVMATNSMGFAVVDLVIQITSTMPKPGPLSYTKNPAVFTVGPTIAPDTCINRGGAATFSVFPALPTGLALNPSTGFITGKPAIAKPRASYVVTASNYGGIARDTLVITVMEAPPGPLAYTENPAIYYMSSPIAANVCTNQGGAASFSVSPPLPAGLACSPLNGIITGTPTMSIAGSYRITATNASGIASVDLAIAVLDPAWYVPSLIAIPSPTNEHLPLFRWHPVSVPVDSYTIQLTTSSTFATVLVSTVSRDTSFACQTPLPYGRIYWRVRAGNYAWSAASFFDVQEDRIPLLISYQPDYTLDQYPMLQWHPVKNATSYILNISNNAAFSSLITIFPLSDTMFKPAAPLPFGKIFWRVSSNLLSTWSGIDSFTIMTDTIPYLVRFNGQTLGISRPAFKWHPVPNSATYRIEIADNRIFNNPISLPLNDTSFTPMANLTNGTWWWRVACDKNFNLYSPLDSVRIQTSVNVSMQLQPKIFTRGITFNPATQSLTISTGSAQDNIQTLYLYNASGRLINSLQPRAVTNLVTWQPFAQSNGNTIPGLYIIKAITTTGILHHKIIR
jgi:hypothetical protein